MQEWASAKDKQIVTVAWGFSLPPNVDTDKVAHQLMEKIQAKSQIGCKDRFIVNGSKWEKNPPPKDLHGKAIHFEAPEEHALDFYRLLVSIYGST
jgi:hypothetical protein